MQPKTLNFTAVFMENCDCTPPYKLNTNLSVSLIHVLHLLFHYTSTSISESCFHSFLNILLQAYFHFLTHRGMCHADTCLYHSVVILHYHEPCIFNLTHPDSFSTCYRAECNSLPMKCLLNDDLFVFQHNIASGPKQFSPATLLCRT